MASSSSHQSFTSKLLVLLTAIPLALAAFAFVLQRRGEYDHLSPPSLDHSHVLPGMEEERVVLSSSFPSYSYSLSSSASLSTSSSDCSSVAGRGSSGSNPLIRRDLDSHPKICITTSTSADLEQLLPWIFYHKVIGVARFFLFVEGMAAERNTSSVLEAIPGVEVIHKTMDLEKEQSVSHILNETWLSRLLNKPCEYELFVKQSLNMEMAIVMAGDAGMDWIIHLDTDELINPAGAHEYSLRQILLDVPGDVGMVIFPNYESSIEHDNITDPFTEVSMFKKNYDHLSKETYYGFHAEASHGNHDYFLTYTNGKSAARIQDHLRPNGTHRWHNYMKTPIEVKLEEAAVLHYTYTKFSDLTSRHYRCACKPTWADAKRCFMLNFDRDAFIISSTATEDEMLKWFHKHVVWNDKDQIVRLLKNGVMTQIHAPMAIIKALKESGIFSTTFASTKT